MADKRSDNPDTNKGAQSQQRLPLASPSPAAQALDNNFRNAVGSLRRDLVRTIYYLRVIFDRKVYRMLGYHKIGDYAADVGGLSDEQCRAFLKIGAKLENLPAMRDALESGTITWRKANAIVDQAGSGNEKKLVDLAKKFSATDLLELTNSRPSAFSSTPTRPIRRPVMAQVSSKSKLQEIRPSDEPCYVTFKFTPEQYSIWTALTVSQPGLSKEEKLTNALHGQNPGQEKVPSTGPNYLLIIQKCPACKREVISNNRGTFAAARPLIETAQCDAVIEDQGANRRHTIPPRLRRKVLQRDNYRCQAADCVNTSHLQIHHRLPSAHGGSTTLDNLVTLCGPCHRALHEQESVLKVANRDPVP